MEKEEKLKVPIKGYIAFFAAIILFSGIFSNVDSWLKVFDFNVLAGSFGKTGIIAEKAVDFRGSGGYGAKDGFLFAITLIPTVILALGIVNMVDGLGGLKAAQKLMTPILKPLLGVSGITALANIANMQSTDAAAGMVKELVDTKQITDEERSIVIMYQTSASAFVTNYFSSGAAVFGFMEIPIIAPIVIMLVFKIVGANLLRIYLAMISKSSHKEVS
ncbi:nucleoside recognition domain-containing protein [Veillonella sp.]|uniref:nucleoside recognition domain-containing protein n=1 Tax=Veillonella sp. TaxID=1926307 RepID=UPI0025FA40F6|nr:nucleoside recognition domain-containing protein [Veillonella sp.]